MYFLDILARYVLPVIYDSLVVLVLVLFFLFMFRIKDSGIRILFFFLPLIKPFIVILEHIDMGRLFDNSPQGVAGMRMPDPTNLIEFDLITENLVSNMNFQILVIILSGVLLLLVLRWIMIAIFYRRLACEDRVTREDVPEVFRTIDRFCQITGTARPEVSLTHRDYISPFVVGIRRFILVLSPRLLDELSQPEKEILIKHELSHIKRRDGLIGWTALILRDLNFFNPFAYVAYYLIRSEQEKACDKLVLKYSETTPLDTAKNILNSILKLKKMINSRKRPLPMAGSPFSPVGFISYKRLDHRIKVMASTDTSRIHIRTFPRILMYILFIILLFIQIVYTLKIGDLVIFLR